MKHTTNQKANMAWITGHPSELVEIHAKYPESSLEVEIYMPGQVFKDIAKILQFTDHVGHAFWHYKNPEMPLPCDTCKH